MARAQHRLIDDTVIEETRQAGVFRRRRIGLLERWADEGVIDPPLASPPREQESGIATIPNRLVQLAVAGS